MKTLFLCLAIFFCVAIAYAEEKRCYSQEDCHEGYCCTGGISPWVKGSCRELASEGELCDPNPPVTEKYFLRCPCKEGLTCVKTENVVSNKSPLCVKE